MKQRILDGGTVNTDSLVASNPEFYNLCTGRDYLYKRNNTQQL